MLSLIWCWLQCWCCFLFCHHWHHHYRPPPAFCCHQCHFFPISLSQSLVVLHWLMLALMQLWILMFLAVMLVPCACLALPMAMMLTFFSIFDVMTQWITLARSSLMVANSFKMHCFLICRLWSILVTLSIWSHHSFKLMLRICPFI